MGNNSRNWNDIIIENDMLNWTCFGELDVIDFASSWKKGKVSNSVNFRIGNSVWTRRIVWVVHPVSTGVGAQLKIRVLGAGTVLYSPALEFRLKSLIFKRLFMSQMYKVATFIQLHRRYSEMKPIYSFLGTLAPFEWSPSGK